MSGREGNAYASFRRLQSALRKPNGPFVVVQSVGGRFWRWDVGTGQPSYPNANELEVLAKVAFHERQHRWQRSIRKVDAFSLQ
jgi:hypothetical protein